MLVQLQDLHDLEKQDCINTSGLLSTRDGRPASYWIIQISSLQAHLCVECVSCVVTGICSDGWLRTVCDTGPGWSWQNLNYCNRDFSSPPLCVGTKFACRWESRRTRRFRTCSRMLMLQALLTRNCANGENIVLRAKQLKSPQQISCTLIEIAWPQGAALIPTTCSASALVQSISHLCLPGVRLSWTIGPPLQLMCAVLTLSEDCLLKTK